MIDFIKSQVLTPKTNKCLEKGVYVFNVDRATNKKTIKETLEKVFNVKIMSVNTYILPGKQRRLGKFKGFKNSYKRAVVYLAPGNVIPFFSSL